MVYPCAVAATSSTIDNLTFLGQRILTSARLAGMGILLQPDDCVEENGIGESFPPRYHE